MAERTSPIGLARYARDYYRAALAADDALGHDEGYEIVAPAPVMFLVAHSIELGLKAFLKHSGMTDKDLRRIGHNLMDCWYACESRGATEVVCLTGEDLGVLGIIADLHISTELRYIKTGFKTFPVFGSLQVVAQKILDGICPHVGYR